MTFFLVFVVFATAVDERGAFNKIAGFAIGLTITMGALFGGPFTGAALNPARAFGPALASNHWNNHMVYWIGPMAGGLVAGWLYDTLCLGKKQSTSEVARTVPVNPGRNGRYKTLRRVPHPLCVSKGAGLNSTPTSTCP